MVLGDHVRCALDRLAILVLVDALAGFFAEVTECNFVEQHFRHDRFAAIGCALAEGFAGREANIQADGVRQFDWPHRHAELFHCGVECFRLDALVQHAKGLLHVRPEHPIDEESRRVLDRQRQLVDLTHECRGLFGVGRSSVGAGHDLHEHHLRHRIEKVDAHQATRVLEVGTDVGELQARGVGREDGAGLGQRLELREQRALGFDVLEDRFDDDIRSGRADARGVRNQSVERIANAARIAQAPLEQCRSTLDRRRQFLGRRVLQRNGNAAHRADGRDVAAHDAGTDDVNMLCLEGRVLAKRLHTLLQEEDADQVLCGRMVE